MTVRLDFRKHMKRTGFEKFVWVFLLLLIVTLTGLAGLLVALNGWLPPIPTPSFLRLRACPELMFTNSQPSFEGDATSEYSYFIYKDERRELSEFDLDWVENHCSVSNQRVW